jgi:hypothetical protein
MRKEGLAFDLGRRWGPLFAQNIIASSMNVLCHSVKLVIDSEGGAGIHKRQ